MVVVSMLVTTLAYAEERNAPSSEAKEIPLALATRAPNAASGLPIIVDAATRLGPSEVNDLLGVNLPTEFPYPVDDQRDPVVRAWRGLGQRLGRPIWLFEGVTFFVKVERNANGALALDFSDFDIGLSRVSKELRSDEVLFTVCCTPKVLSSAPDDPGWYWAYAPANWNEWYEAIFRVVQHIVQHHGVTGAYYEVLNEPEHESFWKGSPGSADTLSDYMTLYASTAKAIKAADPAARVGGPVSSHWDGQGAGWGVWGVPEFLRAVQDHNVASPQDPIPVDFIAWHDYATNLSEGADFMDGLVTALGLPPTIEYLITEWNREWGESCGNFSLQQHASHAAYNLIREADPKRRRFSQLYWFAFSDDLGCQNTALVTARYDQEGKSNPPACLRPAYAVFQMMRAMTGGDYVRVSVPEPLVALATREAGRVSAIVNNNTASSHAATVTVVNLPFGTATVTGTIRQVDTRHSADCQGLEPGSQSLLPVTDKAARVHIDLPPYSVAQFTLEP